MQDSTEFSCTLALLFRDNITLEQYNHGLASVLSQEEKFTKICLLDSRTDVEKDKIIFDFISRTKENCGHNPHYFRCDPEQLMWEYYKIGFRFVNEVFTPQTPLFMFLECDRFIRPDFTKKLRQSFENHKYTCYYRWMELPKSGAKVWNQDSFVAASQTLDTILSSFVTREDFKTVNGIGDVMDSLEPPAPWEACKTIDTLVEIL